MFSQRNILSILCLTGVVAPGFPGAQSQVHGNGIAVSVIEGQVSKARSDVERLRLAIEAIQVSDDDAHLQLMESARGLALDELSRTQESPFVIAGRALMIPTGQKIEEDTQDYGPFAGQHWTEWLLRFIGTLQVRSAQCVTTAEAADAASGVLRVVGDLCAELGSSHASDATIGALRRGAEGLAANLKSGDVVVARRSVDKIGADAFGVRLRKGLAEFPPGEGKFAGRLVYEAYQAEFKEDPCTKARLESRATWASENLDLINGFAAADKANCGQLEEEFMRNRSRRRAESGSRNLQQKADALKAALVEESEETAKLSCLLAIAAAAVKVLPADQEGGLRWQAMDCTLAWTPRNSNGKWFLGTYGTVARRTRDAIEVLIGLVTAIGNETKLPIDVSGVSVRIGCGSGGGFEVRGMDCVHCDEDWLESSFVSLTCGGASSVSEAPSRLCGLRALNYPLFGHGFAYGGLALRVAAIAHDGPSGFVQDVIAQSELIQISRQLTSQVQVGKGDIGAKDALEAFNQCTDGNSCATQILRAAVLRKIATLDSALPGGYASAHTALIEILSLPSDSQLRDYLAQTAPEAVAPLPIDPDAAPFLWTALEGRQDCQPTTPVIVGALAKAFVAAGLPRAEAQEVVARMYVVLRQKGIPNCAIVDRWALSAVPLISQAAGVAALPDPASQVHAMNALEWMLLGAGERQSVSGESRRQAWNSALAPLQQELERLAADGQLDASATASLRESGTRAMGGLRWRAGYPCFPPFNFDPSTSWLRDCIAKAVQRAQADLDRMVPGSVARWPSALTREERQLAIGFLGCRIYEVLATEPEASSAPQGHGAASLPSWAESLGLTVQDPSNPVLTVQRKR